MKRFMSFVWLMIFGLFFNSWLFAQNENEYCGYVDPGRSATQLGGRDLPAIGTVRVLMVFIDFSDDSNNPTSSTWPVGQGPGFLNTFIDSLPGQSTAHWNFTNFFKDMSFNQFSIVGSTIYKQALHTLDWYKNDPTFQGDVGYWAARHVIEALDANWDFSQFDNWEKLANYTHDESADDKVDIVFPIYRHRYSAGGFTVEGYYLNNLSTPFTVDNGARTINRWAFAAPTRLSEEAFFEIVAHEFGHSWGLPHNYSGGLWTLMGHRYPSISPFMNSYERERLAWMTFTDVTVDGTNITIGDLGSDAVAYQVRVNSNEVYLLENHQCESPYDVVNQYAPDLTPGFCGNGLYILHLYESSGSLKIQASDGKWDWSNPYWKHNDWGTNPTDSIPVFQRGAPNPSSGLFDKDQIPHTKSGSDFIFAWLDEATGVEKGQAERHKGIGNSFWSYDQSNVFSPWSNPPAGGTVGVYVTGEDSYSNINATIYTSSPEDSPPARPQNLQATNITDAILISWEANSEPDLAGYEVYRKINNGSIQKISGNNLVTNNSYVDGGLQISNNNLTEHSYYVKAVDNSNKKSTLSIPVVVNVEHVSQGGAKRGANDADITKIPENFELKQNYPNPFNPTTTFTFAMPESAPVRLSIFDLNGRQVAQLINEELPAGRYEIPFDASNLASGVYLYRLSAGQGFSQVRKMMLIK